MADPADPYGFRKIVPPNAKNDLALRGFSCGDGEVDRGVNALVAELHAWGPKARTDSPTVVVMHENGTTVGVGAYHERPLWPIEQPPPDDAYIWVIALTKACRGKGLGIRLLKGLMEHIRDDWGRVPETWAYLAANPPSHKMFKDGGFVWLPSVAEGHDSIRWRAEAPLD